MRASVTGGVHAVVSHLEASAWLTLGTIIAGGLSYGAVALSARILGTADFGLMGVGALATIVLRPTNYAATHLAVALLSRTGGRALRGLLGPAILAGALVAMFSAVLLLVFASPMAAALHSPTLLPILLLAPLVGVSASTQISTGVLSGAHRFSWLAVANVVDALARVVVIAPLVAAFGVAGSLAAYLLGQVSAIVYGVVRLGGIARPSAHVHEGRAGQLTGLATLSMIGGIALLQNGDLVLLRGFGRPEDAGLYAACASLGNLFVTVSAPLYVPAFPRALTAYRRGQGTRTVLVGVLAPVIVAGIAAVVGAVVLGEVVITVIFGADFQAATSILPIFLAKTAVLVVAGVLGQHAVAIGRGRAVHTMIVPAVFGLLALVLVQPEPRATALLMLVASSVQVLILVAASLIVRPAPR